LSYFGKIRNFGWNARLYLLHIFGMDVIHGAWEVLFNLYLLAIGFPVTFIGLRLAVLGVATAIASIPAGRLADRIDRKWGFIIGDGGGAGGIIGNLDYAFLRGIEPTDLYGGADGTIPLLLFVVYQMMFAIITPALITGAFANRVTFKAYLIFLVGWQLFVYFPFVHMIWGGGMLADLGVLDFAGGIVVHALAGMAALASVLYVGKRNVQDSGAHNIPFVALGAALLWFGWFGFNAGSQYVVDEITAVALINTQIAAAFAATTWLFLAWHYDGKPSFVEMLIGMIAGLATITPAAGFVSPQSAMLIGVAAGVVCYFAVVLRKNLELDDALDVWGVHGVGGASMGKTVSIMVILTSS